MGLAVQGIAGRLGFLVGDCFFVKTPPCIDRLVYELYGLTEEEIRIVEGG